MAVPRVECAATPLPSISRGTSVIAQAHLAQISHGLHRNCQAGCVHGCRAERRGSGVKKLIEKRTSSVSK